MTGSRTEKQRLRTARGRTTSSQAWLRRQLNDPLVHQAKAEGYRARSVYKLKELGERFGLIKFGSRTDLVLPHGVEVIVKVGQRVSGGVTIIGRYVDGE